MWLLTQQNYIITQFQTKEILLYRLTCFNFLYFQTKGKTSGWFLDLISVMYKWNLGIISSILQTSSWSNPTLLFVIKFIMIF